MVKELQAAIPTGEKRFTFDLVHMDIAECKLSTAWCRC